MRGVLNGVFCLGVGLMMGGACRESSTDAPLGIVDGYWQGNCQAHTLGSSRVMYLFQAASAVQRTDMIYGDADCSALLGQVNFSGSYLLFTRSEEYTYDIEMKLGRVMGSAVDAAAATLWSQAGFCGHSDWTAGVELELGTASGEGCPALGLVPIDYRDLLRVETRPAQLLFGGSLNHKIPRPSSIDLSRREASFTPAGH